MKNTGTVLAWFLLAILAIGLAGCIISASPDPGTVIEMKPGETRIFKVNVLPSASKTKTVWSVTKFNGIISKPGDTKYFSGDENEFEYTVDPQGEGINRITIGCTTYSWVYRCVTVANMYCEWMWTWQETGYTSWNVRIIQNISPVWNGDYLIRDSTDLKYLNGYTEVAGSLCITTYNSQIINLTGLKNLTTIGGDFYIGNTTITSLSGLENLTSVGGDLYIGNISTTSLSGLQNLTSVSGDLRILSNPALTFLGMVALQNVGSDFLINYNPMLCSFLAEELMNQVLAGGGIGGEVTIIGNKVCTTP